jgi:predicted aspartyl protease
MNWLHLVAAVAATAASTTTIEPGVPVEPENAEALALERERFDRVTVPVTIKGEGPFRFMVDTGAQATVISIVLADRLGLTERSPAILVGMASREQIETTEVPDFQLGSRRYHIRTAPLVEAANIGGADGILGVDSLQNQRVLIDFDKNQIFVADAEELGGNSGYEIVVKARRRLGQLIIANAEVDGIDTAVIVDTGAQSSVGNMALFERLRRSRDLGESRMTDINGVHLMGDVREGRTLELGRMELRDFPILFADSPSFHALGLGDQPALILGMSELRAFRRVAIDFEKRRVLFDLPRNVGGSDFFKRASRIF